MSFHKQIKCQLRNVVGLFGLTLFCGLCISVKSLAAQASVAAQPDTTYALYLPLVAGHTTNGNDHPGSTPTAADPSYTDPA